MTTNPPAKPQWVPNNYSQVCEQCKTEWSFSNRRHHCRGCGHLFCQSCSSREIMLPTWWKYTTPQRVCDGCHHVFTTSAWNSVNNSELASSAQMISQNYLRDKAWTNPILLKGIGRRKPPMKYFFSVEQGNTDGLMTLISSKDSLITSESSKQAFKAMIKALNHPYILPTYHVDYVTDKQTAILIRPFSAVGSLRDRVHRAKPKKEFYLKYSNAATQPIAEKYVPYFGRQILEALNFLRSLGIPYAHLHTSNVILLQNRCCLSDVENTFIGLDPLYLKYMDGTTAPEVIAFGHTLFQMAVGYALGPRTVHESSSRMSKPVYEILCSIFHPTESPTSVKELLRNPFFSNVKLRESITEAVTVRSDLDKKCKLLIQKARGRVKELVKAEAEKHPDTTGVVDDDEAPTAEIPKPVNDPYQGLDINDPLHPLNREKQAARALQRRRKTSKKKRKVPGGVGSEPTRKRSTGSPRRAPQKQPATASPRKAAPKKSKATPKRAKAPPVGGPPAPGGGPPAPGGGPPPPGGSGPPPVSTAVPAAQPGRNNLLASIRQNNKSKLKKVKK
eukprot:TRINITY_DN3762_c0_g2_i2.p1 TRINITY_DN3762_c0_g2~~TRINITY_DN3762_c0_g2_i2.p1  ORF type:complete len:560 (+),score=89.27 TRINITY_DN3762_c0_g2_i2:48-1727(+)